MYNTDWLQKREQLTPNRIALVDVAAGTRCTYRQMNQRANRLANVLKDRFNIERGDRIAVLSMNCAEVLETLFAVGKVGAILVPLNHRLVSEELEYIICDCQPKVLLYEDPFLEKVQELRPRVNIQYYSTLQGNGGLDPTNDYEELLTTAPVTPVHDTTVEFEDPFQILYTSGTTGKPKGVVLSHRMIFWNSVNTMIRDIVPTDITLTHTPLFYTGGLNVYTLPLFHLGGRVVLMRSWDAELALELIEREGITMFFAIPTQFQMMLDSSRFHETDFSSLRFVVSGGAPCPITTMESFRKKGIMFKQGYGLTEVGPGVTAMEFEDAVRKTGSIGVPNFHMEARIVDDEGRTLEAGHVGELTLRAPSMSSGYWNDPEATRRAFRDGWFYTGDLARQDEEGFLFIVGRKKDMFISGGMNVYPAEVESVLYRHPKIAEAAVIGVSHEKWGEVGMAFVVCKKGEQMTSDEVLQFCKEKLAKYKIPKAVEFTDALPKGPSGKILKRELIKRSGRTTP